MRKAHEFTTLPSERSDISPGARELHRLAKKATTYQWTGMVKHAIEKLDQQREAGLDPELGHYTQPGWLVKRQSPQVRARLRQLKSSEAQGLSVDGFYLSEADPRKTGDRVPTPVWHSGK